MTASEFIWPNGDPITVESIRASLQSEGEWVDSDSIVRFLLAEVDAILHTIICTHCGYVGTRGKVVLHGGTETLSCPRCDYEVPPAKSARIDALTATLARVRALADRWAADNQTVWADELRKVLEGS